MAVLASMLLVPLRQPRMEDLLWQVQPAASVWEEMATC